MCAAATTLCAAHYLACSASIYLTQTMGYVKKVALPMQGDPVFTCTNASCCRMPWAPAAGTHVAAQAPQRGTLAPHNAQGPSKRLHCLSADTARCCLADLILFTATANTSIVTLNLSLLLNKVGFYQARCTAMRMSTCTLCHQIVTIGQTACQKCC